MKPPSKKTIEAAVRAARLYAGSEQCSIRDQQKLYSQLRRRMAPLERYTDDAWDQIGQRAAALGPIRPIPGRDI